MAERRRIIEGTWKCSQCDTADIPGSRKDCPSCGSPREDTEAKFDFSKREAVTDAGKLELAAAGADWYCRSCDSANKGNATKCAVCGDSDPASRLAKKPVKPAAPPQAAAPPPPRRGLLAGVGVAGCAVFAIGGLLVFTLLVVLVLATWTSEAPGQVTAMHWERSIQTETFTPVVGKTGWKRDLKLVPSKMPHDGRGEVVGVDNLRDCRTLERTPKKCEWKTKDVACGTEEKCTLEDKGNGFAEEVCKDVTKYCAEKFEECTAAVFDDKCTYDTWEWRAAGAAVVAKGDDAAPRWPTAPPPGAHDRQVKAERYTVTLSADGETNTWEPTTEAEFTRFAVGQPVTVTTNALGSVTAVEPR